MNPIRDVAPDLAEHTHVRTGMMAVHPHFRDFGDGIEAQLEATASARREFDVLPVPSARSLTPVERVAVKAPEFGFP